MTNVENFPVLWACFVILLTTLVLFIFATRNWRTCRNNLPPGSYGWPFVGETIEYIRTRNAGSPEKFARDRMDKYKSNVFKTSLFGESMAMLCGPAENKFLFTNENKLVTVWWPPSVHRLIGPSISTTPGLEGVIMRKMVSHFFTPDAFAKSYIKTMDIVSRQHVNTYWQGKEKLLVYPAMRLYTFEVACRLFMSIDEPQQIKRLSSLFEVFVTGILSIPINFPGTRFYKAMKATATIKKELKTIVQHRRVALEQKSATALATKDLLSHLLLSRDENGKSMHETIIINNILMLLFAGHDTTSSTLSMLIKALADHPHVYARVLAEQTEIVSSKEDIEFLQWEDIAKMKYSWNVISETLRLWPAVIGSFREALTDISYAGYDIPKGWKFSWNSTLTHKDSNLFMDSNKFDPSRFEKDECSIPYAFVPFGGGPRMCLGKEFARVEMLVLLHNVVQRCQWSLVNPDEGIKCDPMFTPAEGLPILLHPHKT